MSSRLAHVLIALLVTIPIFAQTQPAAPSTSQQEVDPLKRPIDAKTQKKQQKALRHEDPYWNWPDGDAAKWIITDEEREAFKKLGTDEEREKFIEQFWYRRDPTPDTLENEYKEEHYRRVAYANEHFSSGKAGWLTDRGHIYIAWGPPTQIESHPAGGLHVGTARQGQGVTYPFEIWRYRYLEGQDLGQEVEIEFVDECMCGEYEMTIDPTKKSALKNVPGHQDDFKPQFPGSDSKVFDDMARQKALLNAPEVKFKDLLPHVGTTIRYNVLPFDVRADFVRLTSDVVLVPITVQLQNKELVWTGKDGVQRMTVNILGRVTSITGKTIQTFEDTVTDMVADDLLPKIAENSHVYWKALPIAPGAYRLDLVLKDMNSDRLGTWSKRLSVPRYEEDKLATSSLILADVMERTPKISLNTGNFVIGDMKVRPRLDTADGKPATFKRAQPLNVCMQVYNLAMSDKTRKPDTAIEYEIVNSATHKSVWKLSESTGQFSNPGEQITLQKTLPLSTFEPGTYELTINVNDKVSTQSTRASARFTVE